MHRNLPQCGRTPARCAFGAPAPAGSTANLGGSGPKRVWVSLFSVGSARGWSKTRLGFAVFGGLRAWVVRNASGFDGFGWIRVDSVRLRRILDHMPVKPPFPPETQTHFGPPNRWGTGPLEHRAGTGGGVEAAARGKHPHRAGLRPLTLPSVVALPHDRAWAAAPPAASRAPTTTRRAPLEVPRPIAPPRAHLCRPRPPPHSPRSHLGGLTWCGRAEPPWGRGGARAPCPRP